MYRLRKNRKSFWLFLTGILLMAVLLAGCRKNETPESDYYLYYLNQQEDNIVPEAYEAEATETGDLVEEIASHIMDLPENVDDRRLMPESVVLEKTEFDGSYVSLYFNSAYLEKMSRTTEILCRGAITYDMMQISGVKGVYFFVDGEPLVDAKGEEVGKMTLDSFLENPGKEINDIQEADITLYFASEDGNSLVAESQHVYYPSNISIEKLVMERLLEGPESENARSAIPSDTGLISVSVMDGVCFVNLDDNFLNQNYDISEEVVIYSIVDSLTELSNVNTVQISVNGNTDLAYRDQYALSQYYEMNRSLITAQGENVEVNQQEGDADSKVDTAQ